MFWTGREVADLNQGQKTIKMNHRNKIQSLVSPTDDPGDAPDCFTESGPCTWDMAISAINRPIFQNKGFPLNQRWVMCGRTLQDRWAPPEHPRDTSHGFSASCCRLPIRPVQTGRRACKQVSRHASSWADMRRWQPQTQRGLRRFATAQTATGG